MNSISMKYNIIYAPDLETLAARVQGFIQNGWEPHAAPFYDDRCQRWCQSIVNREPAKKLTAEEIRLREASNRTEYIPGLKPKAS